MWFEYIIIYNFTHIKSHTSYLNSIVNQNKIASYKKKILFLFRFVLNMGIFIYFYPLIKVG